MDSKEKKVSECFEDYKDLPPEMRARVITTARNLLEIQEGDKGFIDKAVDPSLYEDEKNI